MHNGDQIIRVLIWQLSRYCTPSTFPVVVACFINVMFYFSFSLLEVVRLSKRVLQNAPKKIHPVVVV